nr:HMG-box transcription factor Rop1-1 [Ustilago maydis]
MMAQQGYGIGPGPSRLSQWDDRGLGQARTETEAPAPPSSHFVALARPTFADAAPLFSSSSSSYDHIDGGVRAEPSSDPLANITSQQQNESQSSATYTSALSNHPTHYNQYTDSSQHNAHSSSHALQHASSQLSYQQLQQQQQQLQLQHQNYQYHLQLSSNQPLDVHMPGDLTASQSLGVHHAPESYALHHHPAHQQSDPEGQRKSYDRAETAEPHTPRPPNAWILYRSQKFREIQQNRNSQCRSGLTEKPKSQAEISRIVSQMWQNESSAVKQKFEAMADEKKLAHQKMYPTYRYRPKKKAKAKQSASSQRDASQRRIWDEKAIKKETYGAYAGGSQDYDASEGGFMVRHATDRRGDSEPQYPGAGHDASVSSSMHDLVGRDLISRRPLFGERRERGELATPANYGRSISASLSPGEGTSFSYNNSRMHPFGERPSSLLRQESPRVSDASSEPPTSSGVYTNSHWPDADTLGGLSCNTYFDGSASRSATTGYTTIANSRMPSSSLMGSNAMGGASLPTLPSPQQQPPRQSIPSQHLQHPIGYSESSLSFQGLTGAGNSFRPSAMTHPVARFAPSFSESKAEVSNGLTLSSSNESASGH